MERIILGACGLGIWAFGAYYAFQKVGQYYSVGDAMMILYAIANLITTTAVLILTIDAPLRMLLGSADERYIPKSLFKQNDKGVYTRSGVSQDFRVFSGDGGAYNASLQLRGNVSGHSV